MLAKPSNKLLTVPGPGAALAGSQPPLPSLLLPQQDVVAHRDRAQLALELAPAVQALARQLPGLDRCEDGAFGLVRVCAVGEAAVRCEFFDVREGRIQSGRVDGPELQLSKAGGVD